METSAAVAQSAKIDHVQRLEDEVLALPQTVVPTRHLVVAGLYCRSITVEPGMVITGASHRDDHICVVDGDITVTTDAGPRRLTGRHELMGRAGHKRAGFTHATTHWTTISRTTKTGVAEIEDELFDEPERLQSRVLALPSAFMERDDYSRFLAEYGLTDEAVKAMVADHSDHAELPAGGMAKAYIGPSEIEGRGLFAALALAEDEEIVAARIGMLRTIPGRLANHSPAPNCRVQALPCGSAWLVAKRAIRACDELTVDYRQAASVSRWLLAPDADELLATLKVRAQSFKSLGGAWLGWSCMGDAELRGVLAQMLGGGGYLMSVDDVPTDFDKQGA